jgi:hypothetical protein
MMDRDDESANIIELGDMNAIRLWLGAKPVNDEAFVSSSHTPICNSDLAILRSKISFPRLAPLHLDGRSEMFRAKAQAVTGGPGSRP